MAALKDYISVAKNDENKTNYWLASINLGIIAPQDFEAAFTYTKMINIGINEPIKLDLVCKRYSIDHIAVSVQIYPTGNQYYLPKGLSLIILDEENNICFEEYINKHEDSTYSRISITVKFNEYFGIKIKFKKSIYIENFNKLNMSPPIIGNIKSYW